MLVHAKVLLQIANEFETVPAEELSNIKMTTGNEREYTKVIDRGVLKEWVGIGWIDTDPEPSVNDYERYPAVVYG